MRTLFFFLALAALTIASCTPKAAKMDDKIKMVDFEATQTLGPGDAIQVKGQTGSFTFVSVENDSRCPKGVNCIQAGEATILVELMDGKQKRVTIDADYRRVERVVTGNVVVDIIALNPYPVNAKPTAKEDYKLLLRTTPLKE